MMRRFDLVAEAGVAGGGHDLFRAGRLDALRADPQAVAHGVELGEVARRLARQDQVVGGQRVGEARARDLDDLGPGVDQVLHGLVEAGLHAGLEPLAGELAHDADPQALHVGTPGGLDERGHRGVDRRGVHRVVPGDHLVEQGGVEHGAGARAGLVERARQRHEAVARHPAVGRLGADRAGDGRGLADRAAGVGADRQRRLERRDDRRRPAARPAGDPLEVPRVVARAVGAVLGRRAHRELVHVGLAEDRHPGLAQPGHQGRVVRRHPALQDPATRTWSAGPGSP